MTRRRFTEREVLECLIRQGAVIPCKRCRLALTVEDAKSAEREHLHEIGLDGSDTVENCAFSHAECHRAVTHGNGATFAGSSRHKVKKATDPERIEKFRVVKTPLDAIIEGPAGRCHRCGQYPDECECRSQARRQRFGGRRQ